MFGGMNSCQFIILLSSYDELICVSESIMKAFENLDVFVKVIKENE